MITVIGGLGFIGTHLCNQFKETVSVYDLKSKEEAERNIERRGHQIYFNNRNQLDYLIKQSYRVYNLAGILGTESTFKHIHKTISTNITFAVDIMQKCMKYQVNLVNVGIARDWWLSPYAITKNCMRRFGKMFYKEGLRGCTIIPYNAYGRGQVYSKVQKLVPTVMHHIFHEKPIAVYGGGKQVVDMIYVEDLASAIAKIDNFDGQEIEMGSGQKISVIEVIEKIHEIMSEYGYDYLELKMEPVRKGEDKNEQAVADNNVAQTSLDKGLRETVKWFYNSTSLERTE